MNSVQLAILLGSSPNRERHCRLSRYYNLLLTRSDCDAGTSSAACGGSNQGSFSSAGEASDQRTGSSSAADLSDVALGVALALESVCACGNGLAVNFGEPYRQQARSMEPSAVLNASYPALSWIANLG